MPTLRILTNAQVPAEDRADLFAHASRTVAELLGKPEAYIMVILEDGRDLFFAGTCDPAAYQTVKDAVDAAKLPVIVISANRNMADCFRDQSYILAFLEYECRSSKSGVPIVPGYSLMKRITSYIE